MRSIIVLFLCLLVIVSASPDSCAEPATQSGISFSLPFTCGEEGRAGGCLADSIERGSKVTLINKTETCKATAVETFIYDHRAAASEFKATRLVGTRECFFLRPEEESSYGRFQVAVLGVEPEAVRLISTIHDNSPVPKDMELEARRILRNDVLPKGTEFIAPRLVSLEGSEVAVVQLGYTHDGESAWKDGPSVLFANNSATRLDGDCTWEHLFFTANNKLHLAYIGAGCCGCGEWILYVYDVSGKVPKKVYENGSLSD